MDRWLYIKADDAFWYINCSHITHFVYNGETIFTFCIPNDSVSIDFKYDEHKYRKYVDKISDFVMNGDEDGNIMLIDTSGPKNIVKVIKNEKKARTFNID